MPGVGVERPRGRRGGRADEQDAHPHQVLAAFGGRIEPVRPTILYRLWILIVAAVMVLLPLVYIAIIGLVVGAVVYHAIHNVSIFQHVRGGALKFAALIYAAPLVAGAMVVALMIKPLFARRRAGRSRGRSTRAKSRSCTPSWTASATRSARRGRADRGRLPASTPRRTATGACSACWAAS